MKVKKKYVGYKAYSKNLGRFVAVTEANYHIFKKENLTVFYVTTKAKPEPETSASAESVSNDTDA